MGLFILLHYLYDFFPNVIIEIISGTDESLYQHLKIAFYAYVFLTIIEAGIFRNQIEDPSKFWFSHLFSAVIIPWIIFILWFIGPAIHGKFTSLVVDVIYANIITYVSLVILSMLETWYGELEYPTNIKVIILLLFGLSVLEFTLFTYFLPWHDVFIEPLD